MRVLGIETSCDETGVALYEAGVGIRAERLASQISLHAAYGGVVPELASRDHIAKLLPMVETVLEDAQIELGGLDAIAYTAGPGLIGALMVGGSLASSLAYALKVPAIAVHHLEGHILACMLEEPAPEFPFLALMVSGGHSQLIEVLGLGRYRIVGETLDDAAGEAFDKGARLLGLGYPGGAAIDRLAREGDADAFDFPVARVPGLDFSFSGVKTALLYAVRDLPADELEARRADLAASYQRAIVRALVERAHEAAAQLDAGQIAIVGGVAANSELRAALPEARPAPLELCTDNAAMIASAARYLDDAADPLRLDAYAVA